METLSLEAQLQADLKEKMKRLMALRDQRALQEQILKNLTREINSVEAVVSYIQVKLAGIKA